MDEFQGDDAASEQVVKAWRNYLAAMNNTPESVIADPSSKEAQDWFAARDELLVDLLFEMSVALGYRFDRNQIRSGSYAPIMYLTNEAEAGEVRTGLRELLAGKRPLQIATQHSVGPVAAADVRGPASPDSQSTR